MNASKTVCIDQIPKVIAAAKESLFIREQVAASTRRWVGPIWETQAHNTIRSQNPPTFG